MTLIDQKREESPLINVIHWKMRALPQASNFLLFSQIEWLLSLQTELFLGTHAVFNFKISSAVIFAT